MAHAGGPFFRVAQRDGIDHARLEGGFAGDGEILHQRLALGEDRNGHHRTGRNGHVVPGGHHPGSQGLPGGNRDILKRQGDFFDLLLAVAFAEDRAVGRKGEFRRRGDIGRHRQVELPYADLLERTAVFLGPGGAEREFRIGIDPVQQRFVAEMVQIVIPLLHLLRPVGLSSLFAGKINLEGRALHRLADEFGLLGGESLLDGEDFGRLAHNGEFVVIVPGPGKERRKAGALHGIILGENGTDRHQLSGGGNRRFGGLVAGRRGEERQEC